MSFKAITDLNRGKRVQPWRQNGRSKLSGKKIHSNC